MRRAIVALVLVPLLGGASDSTRPITPIDPCAKRVTAKQFRPFAAAVWRPSAWQRGKPPAKTIRAQRHKLACAAGPGHRKAMKRRWRAAKTAYYRHRRQVRATHRWEPYVCGGRRYALPCGVTKCESGYYFGHRSGAYGLLDSTWAYWGGRRFAPYPGAATPRQQAIIARRVWEAVGPSGWECKADGSTSWP